MSVVKRRWPMQVALLAVCALLALVAIFFAVDAVTTLQSCSQLVCQNEVPWLVEDCGGVLAAALMLGAFVGYARTLLGNDRRRQGAARQVGRAIPLESEMRAAEPSTLALPATLRIRLAWRTKQMAIVFGSVFVLIEDIYGCTLLSMRDDPFITSSVWLGVQGLLLGMLLFLFGLMWFAARERVVATEDGLRVRRFGVTRRIRWSDSRLFAKVKPAEYELSGPRAIVRWTRPVDASSYDTVIQFEEYQRQMDGLLLLIVERTGRPLADLRAPER